MVSEDIDTPARVATTASPPAQVTGRTWLATAALLVALFTELVNVTLVNVAVPSIQHGLHASYGEVQWVVAIYALAFAVILLTGGRLGDIYGRKRMFVTGLVAFIAFSVLCAAAPNPAVLITARALLGVAAAVMLPQVLSFINVWFPEEQREAAFGLFGAVIGLGSLAAPLIGGVLVNADVFGLTWRAIFLLNVPLGLLALVGVLLLVTESRAPERLRLDPLGVLLSVASMFLLVYPVIQGRDAGWPWWIWVMLVASVPVFALFVLVERWKTRRDGSPVVDLTLFRNRGFVGGTLATLVFYLGVVAIAFVLMIFLQQGYGYSPLRSGLTIVPLALGTVIGSIISIGAVVRVGRAILQVGAGLAVVGSAWLAYIVNAHDTTLSTWDIVGPLALVGLGIGLFAAPVTNLVLAGIGTSNTGSASGMLNSTIQTGSAIGVAIIGVIFFGSLGGGAAIARQSFSHALRDSAYFEMVVFGVTLLLVFLIPNVSRAALERQAKAGG